MTPIHSLDTALSTPLTQAIPAFAMHLSHPFQSLYGYPSLPQMSVSAGIVLIYPRSLPRASWIDSKPRPWTNTMANHGLVLKASSHPPVTHQFAANLTQASGKSRQEHSTAPASFRHWKPKFAGWPNLPRVLSDSSEMARNGQFVTMWLRF